MFKRTLMSTELWHKLRSLIGQTFTPNAGKSRGRYRQLEFEFCARNEGLMNGRYARQTGYSPKEVTISSNLRKPLDKLALNCFKLKH